MLAGGLEMAFKDMRRTDARDDIQRTPYWMTSAEIDCADTGAGDGDIVLFSFPNTGYTYLVHGAYAEIIVVLDAGDLDVGDGTLPLDTTGESGTYTEVNAASILATAQITEATIGLYEGVLTTAAPIELVGAAATVPCIHADLSAAVTGKFRVHVLVSAIPNYQV